MNRREEMIVMARVMASQEVRAYRVFEVRGTDEAAQAFLIQRAGDGGSFCVLAEEKLDEGKAKVREVVGIDALEFVEQLRATPPQWN